MSCFFLGLPSGQKISCMGGTFVAKLLKTEETHNIKIIFISFVSNLAAGKVKGKDFLCFLCYALEKREQGCAVTTFITFIILFQTPETA